LFHGVEIPFLSNQHRSGPFKEWLHHLGDKHLNISLKALRRLFDYLSAEKKWLNHGVIQLARDEKYSQRLRFLKACPVSRPYVLWTPWLSFRISVVLKPPMSIKPIMVQRHLGIPVGNISVWDIFPAQAMIGYHPN
jgi:hypothetical protein